MKPRLFLLDGMALVYRAHFAFASRPIYTSKGVNTSALLGYANTLVDLIRNQSPTHLAVAFDTSAPTKRHEVFPEYKANREKMPEELSAALPHVFRLTEAFNIPVLKYDGFEADDIIGTLVKRAEPEGFESYMVTPDKDFAQLVSETTYMYKPARAGNGVDVLGLKEVLENWGIERPEQVIDILGLWGDSVDNIPGVPGIGEKTAKKLIAQYGSVESLLEHSADLKGKQREKLEANRDQALLSKALATIDLEVPVDVPLEDLKCRNFNEEKLKSILVEFELNALGRRLFSQDFKAGRGFSGGQAEAEKSKPSQAIDGELFDINLSNAASVEHQYKSVTDESDVDSLIEQLMNRGSVCFDLETTSLDPRVAEIVGIAFSVEAHQGVFVPLAEGKAGLERLEKFRPLLESDGIEKTGHNLKYDMSVLRWHDIVVKGKIFDTMIAHSLLEQDQRHGMDYLSEAILGYAPIPISSLIGADKKEQISMREVALEKLTEYAAEDADITCQLRTKLEPDLKEKGLERVFHEIESPLLSTLVEMEHEGISLDVDVLTEFSKELEKEIVAARSDIYGLAGIEFNLNSPKQLGEVLFERLKIVEKPKKTKTGQYATNEQTLQWLSGQHEIVRRLLEYRSVTKLKSTYVDSLPKEVFEKTNRVHTTYNQAVTATGRLQSQGPNLQNIPIRTKQGREIRKAFIPRNKEFLLLAADYSQIELRIIAALSKDPAMVAAFEADRDIHSATAARVFGVVLEEVDPEMRRKAKMVNFGLAYGMSAFGLSQRLGIPRKDAQEILESYFEQFPGIKKYMDSTLEFARENGFVQTVSGRRRYLRDIQSGNATVRGAAERNAINMPIQGTAADMIKIAMSSIQSELWSRSLRSKMLLQVHDELVFDMYLTEEQELRGLVQEKMLNALPLGVPIKVEMGTGRTWLEAH